MVYLAIIFMAIFMLLEIRSTIGSNIARDNPIITTIALSIFLLGGGLVIYLLTKLL